MRISALMGLVLGVTVMAGAQTTAPWSYQGNTGPLNWGKLDPSYKTCRDGHEQSPIDIRGAHLNKSLPDIEFHYLGAPLTLENTGNTIRAVVHPGSYIVWQGVRYELQDFDFHHPGEEAVKGKLPDMDIHLVHKSADGKLAIIAVRLVEDPGSPNVILAALWEHLPTKSGASEKIDSLINPGGLLPGDRGYWTYMGSLSAPPCTEGVRWFVMEQPIAISREQLRQFAAIYRINSRGLQDPHGRKIEANE